jgi:hypothetical protein
MPHTQCPNIKTGILELRAKVSELESLKASLFGGDTDCQERFKVLQEEIIALVRGIDEKIDDIANEVIRPEIRKSRKYLTAGNYNQGRSRVTNSDGNFFHIGIDEKPVYDEQYISATYYKNGKAYVMTPDNQTFYIDLYGNRIVNGIN